MDSSQSDPNQRRATRAPLGSILYPLRRGALAEEQTSQAEVAALISYRSIHRLHWRVSRVKHEFHVSPVVPSIRTVGSEEGNAPPAARLNLVSTLGGKTRPLAKASGRHL